LSAPTQRIGNIIWVLIFGGLFVVALGVALERSGESYGWGFIAAGTAAVAVGCVLIWVRSRMTGP